MNRHSTTTETPNPEQADRMRWAFLGLKPADLSDIPDQVQHAFRQRLHQRVTASPSSSPGRRWPKRWSTPMTVAATLAIATLFFVWTVQTAIANQRQRIHQHFANRMVEVTLDIYDEDVSVLSERVAQSELLLPDPSFWLRNDPDEQKMYISQQALQALLIARMGLPEASAGQLSEARQLIHDQESGIHVTGDRSLDFIFHVLTGKACIESVDTLGQRGALLTSREIIVQLQRDGETALEYALQLLAQNARDLGNNQQHAMLQAALKTDLARIRMRSEPSAESGETIEQRDQHVEALLIESELALQELAIDTDSSQHRNQILLHQARVLNNQILLDYRRCRRQGESIAASVLWARLAGFRATLDEFAQIEVHKQDQYWHGIAFELGVGYSNLADLVQILPPADPSESFSLSEEDRLDLILKLREESIDSLTHVSRLRRSERHRENLMMNQALWLAVRLELLARQNPEQVLALPADITAVANYLQRSLGNVVDPQIGQFNPQCQFAVAFCLPDEYPESVLEDLRDKLAPADPAFGDWAERLLDARRQATQL